MLERKILRKNKQERGQNEEISLIRQEMAMKEQEAKERQKDAAAAEKRENRLSGLLRQQQVLFSHISQLNQLLLDLLKNLSEKFLSNK